MDTVSYNYSLGIEIGWPFLYLFICSNTMIYCSETSICRSKVDNFIHHSTIFFHWSISSLFQSSFVQAFATEFVLVRLSIVATIGFTAETNHFGASEFFLEKTWLPFIILLMLRTTCSREKVV